MTELLGHHRAGLDLVRDAVVDAREDRSQDEIGIAVGAAGAVLDARVLGAEIGMRSATPR